MKKRIIINGLEHNIHKNLFQLLVNQYSSFFIAKEIQFGYFDFFSKLKNYDIFHGITYSRSTKLFFLAKLKGLKTINHWMGSDVLFAKKSKYALLKVKITSIFVDKHFACSKELVNELKLIGIKADYMPVIPKKIVRTHEIKPLPDKFTVLTYLPDDRHEFYGSNYIHRLAHEFPEIKFIVVAGSGGYAKQLKNIKYLGFVKNMEKYYNDSNILIRMVKHDGFSLCVQEAMGYGRHVIYSYKQKYCFYSKTYDDVKKYVLTQIKNPTLNLEGHNYIAQKMSHEILSKKLDNLYLSIL